MSNCVICGSKSECLEWCGESPREQIEKLKKQNQEYARLIEHIGNLVEEKVERVDFFCLGDNVHSIYFENMPIFEKARQALKDIEGMNN